MPVALIVSLTLGLLYARTIAPDLTWANFSADGGDFLAAIATGGVPHPGGYPFYLVLGGLFQRFPFGEPAFRTNLLSAIATILTANLVALMTSNWLAGGRWRQWLAVIAGLAYGLAPFVWGQALVTEVYALHALLVSLCLFVHPKARQALVGLCFGIAAANHLAALLVLPLLVLGGEEHWWVGPRELGKRFLGLLAGLSLYLLLPLRAAAHPVINWGDASSLEGFAWLVSGRLYSGYLFATPLPDMLQRLRGLGSLLLEQYGAVGVFLAAWGRVGMSHGRERFRAASLWIVLVFGAFAIQYGTADSQVYMAPVWPVMAVWIALGLGSLLDLFGSRGWAQGILVAGALLLVLLRLPRTIQQVDLSRDASATIWITQTLDAIPDRALVFVAGDRQVFALWYAQFAKKRRMDVSIIADGLLVYPWYLRSLGDAYPGLGVPFAGQVHAPDFVVLNPGRAFCRLEEASEPVCAQDSLPPGK